MVEHEVHTAAGDKLVVGAPLAGAPLGAAPGRPQHLSWRAEDGQALA